MCCSEMCSGSTLALFEFSLAEYYYNINLVLIDLLYKSNSNPQISSE